MQCVFGLMSLRRCRGVSDQRHATPFFRCHRRASSALMTAESRRKLLTGRQVLTDSASSTRPARWLRTPPPVASPDRSSDSVEQERSVLRWMRGAIDCCANECRPEVSPTRSTSHNQQLSGADSRSRLGEIASQEDQQKQHEIARKRIGWEAGIRTPIPHTWTSPDSRFLNPES
jgi:hypothetical protein